MEDRARESEILREAAVAGDNLRVLEMTDGGEALGWVITGLEARALVIYGFSVQGQSNFSAEKPGMETAFVLDTLLRAAASYGEVNGADAIRTVFPDFFDFFRARGFEAAENCVMAPMSVIVRYE